MARIRGFDNALITAASVTELRYTVVPADDTANPTVASTNLTPIATYIFDTLKTDAIWTADDTGYNFKHTLPTAAMPNGDKVYLANYRFKDTGTPANISVLSFKLPTKKQYVTG